MSRKLIIGLLGLVLASLVAAGYSGITAAASVRAVPQINRHLEPQPGSIFTTEIDRADIQAAFGPTLAAANNSFQGNWELQLMDHSRYSASLNGQMVVEGLYSNTADRLMFYGGRWSASCADTGDMGRRPYHAPGGYSFDFDGTRLVLNAQSEDCQARKLIVSSKPLVLTTGR